MEETNFKFQTKKFLHVITENDDLGLKESQKTKNESRGQEALKE